MGEGLFPAMMGVEPTRTLAKVVDRFVVATIRMCYRTSFSCAALRGRGVLPYARSDCSCLSLPRLLPFAATAPASKSALPDSFPLLAWPHFDMYCCRAGLREFPRLGDDGGNHGGAFFFHRDTTAVGCALVVRSRCRTTRTP